MAANQGGWLGPILRLIFGIASLLVILAGVAVTLPNHVRVARSVVIDGSQATVFPHVNNMHKLAAWLPWAQRDPKLALVYSGPPAGRGATLTWISKDRSIGAGRMEIVRSEPSHRVDFTVDYNGLKGSSYVLIQPRSSGAGSKVTWGYGYDTGPNVLRRWQGLILDRMIGSQYDLGLKGLKRIVQAELTPKD